MVIAKSKNSQEKPIEAQLSLQNDLGYMLPRHFLHNISALDMCRWENRADYDFTRTEMPNPNAEPCRHWGWAFISLTCAWLIVLEQNCIHILMAGRELPAQDHLLQHDNNMLSNMQHCYPGGLGDPMTPVHEFWFAIMSKNRSSC